MQAGLLRSFAIMEELRSEDIDIKHYIKDCHSPESPKVAAFLTKDRPRALFQKTHRKKSQRYFSYFEAFEGVPELQRSL